MSGHVVATAPRPGAGGSRSIPLKLPDQKDPAPGGKPAAVGSAEGPCGGGAEARRRWSGQREDGGAGPGRGRERARTPGRGALLVYLYVRILSIYVCVCVFV